MKRDGANESLWQTNTPAYESKNTVNDKGLYDVIIIGGGITGITTGLLLQQAGKKCLIAEAASLGFGTTGGTTAHLNDFFDSPYHTVKKNFGADNAGLLAQAAREAMGLIKDNVKEFKIDCNYEEREGYLFALNDKQSQELDELVAASQEVGVEVDFINDSPFPIPYLKVACFRNQAQFHPARYILKLAEAFEAAGGTIVQNCRVLELEGGDVIEAKSDMGNFRARYAIYATHVPPGVNILHFRCAPYRSYAIAVKLKTKYPQALGYDMNDPYHYYRTQEVDGQQYLIAGGEDHKTGHEENTGACFRRLESHVKSYFEVEAVAYRWSSQYFEPADGLPYIGHLPGNGDNVLVATGFGGNGMIYGTISGILLRDLIINNKSMYKDLFHPGRVKPLAAMSNFVKEAVDVVKELITAPFKAEQLKEFSEMAPEEGKVVDFNGHKLAVHKDGAGALHAVNAACTHIKCTIAWNGSEKSWDCPCHGSRFAIDGSVLTAPATKALEKIHLESNA